MKQQHPNAVTVMKPNEYGTQMVRFQEAPTRILMSYPRQELMFMSEEEYNEERFYVGTVPETSTKQGRSIIIPRKDGIGTSTIGDGIKIPEGQYVMETAPEYIDGIDWYELVPITEGEKLSII
jgi:hypothetical protein